MSLAAEAEAVPQALAVVLAVAVMPEPMQDLLLLEVVQQAVGPEQVRWVGAVGGHLGG